MLDIRVIRSNPEKVNELLKRRNPDLSIDNVIKIDEERRIVQTKADELRSKRKSVSKEIGIAIKNGQDTSSIQAEVKEIGEEISNLEEKERELEEKQRVLLLNIPNTPDESTPIGKSEDDNIKNLICIPFRNLR